MLVLNDGDKPSIIITEDETIITNDLDRLIAYPEGIDVMVSGVLTDLKVIIQFYLENKP